MPDAGRGWLPPSEGFRASTKEEDMKRLIVLMMLAMFAAPMLTACNTMAGAGKDVQKAGEEVEDAAKKDDGT